MMAVLRSEPPALRQNVAPDVRQSEVKPFRDPIDIAIFDTSAASDNLGDEIIMQAVRSEIEALFPQAHLWTLPTHDAYGRIGRRILERCRFAVVGGTNLLSNKMPSGGRWKLPARRRLLAPWTPDYGLPIPVVLMGCGRGEGMQHVTPATRQFLQRTLWTKVPSALRDQATAELLVGALGSGRATNTSCVTLWPLATAPAGVHSIPSLKANTVLLTLTDYKPSPADDKKLINLLRSCYRDIYFWPQGASDLAYFRVLEADGIQILDHSVASLAAFLSATPLHYVGTRLHAGALALKYGRHSFVVSVDNRASDLGVTIGLPCAARGDLDSVERWIRAGGRVELRLPWKAIEAWRYSLVRAAAETGGV